MEDPTVEVRGGVEFDAENTLEAINDVLDENNETDGAARVGNIVVHGDLFDDADGYVVDMESGEVSDGVNLATVRDDAEDALTDPFDEYVASRNYILVGTDVTNDAELVASYDVVVQYYEDSEAFDPRFTGSEMRGLIEDESVKVEVVESDGDIIEIALFDIRE